MKAADEIRGVLTGLALVAAVLLFSISVDIGVPGQSILQSLRFHAAAACLVLPAALLIARAPRRAAAMLLLIVLSVGIGLWPLWALHQRRAAVDGSPVVASLDLLSFNVLATNSESGKIAGYLLAETPDVAIIMETPGIEGFLPDLQTALPYRAGCTIAGHCDTAILSRLPLIAPRVLPFGPLLRDRLIIAGVAVGGQLVTVIAMHLTKPYFDGMSDVELGQLRDQLAQIDGPVVLAGDFNAAPWSDSVVATAQVSALIPPPVAPATWPVELGALGLPIDNMFTRGPALIGEIAALPDAMGSNHRALRARIDIFAPR